MTRVTFHLLYVGWMLATAPVLVQAGTLVGTILDAESGHELIGASILLVGTARGASTDLDGQFSIADIPSGTYDIRISLVGYNTKVVPGTVIPEDGTVTLEATLAAVEAQAFTIDDIRVTAGRVMSTSAAILADRKKAANIGDAISAEEISKSPDATSGDALKRVTGLTVVDNKYVYIRGVTDRYNSTVFNGVNVTSTDVDVDRKSFAFDMIPASLISSTVVIKSATPDLQGDFAGGLVKVNTLDFPTEKVMRLTFAGGSDNQTTGKDFQTYWGGDLDALAFDDGMRELPQDIPVGELPQVLPNNWATRTKTAPPNSQVNFGYGNRWRLGSSELGLLGALSYNNKYLSEEFKERPSFQGVPLFEFDGIQYKKSVLLGGMLNLNFRKDTHKLSWRNNFNQSAQDQVRISAGMAASADSTRRQTSEWNQRSFLLTQLEGDHIIPALNAAEFGWTAYYTKSIAKQPDRKHVEFQQGSFSNDFFLRENYRTWSDLKEDGRGFNFDLSLFLNSKLKGGFSLGETTFMLGALVSNRKRHYQIDAFFTDTANIIDYEFFERLGWSVDSVFIPENYGPGRFVFQSYGPFSGFYTGRHDLLAYYAKLDQPFGLGKARFRLTGGIRVENSDQIVNSWDDLEPVQAQVKEEDPLPSVNLTWLVSDRVNVRAATYRSVNRPEFRELAPVLYYDFDQSQNVVGNPNLERAIIQNFDLRFEAFPSGNEVLAASAFYKDFTNAIEEQLIPSPERFVRTWFNSPSGENYGYELEFRKDLGFLSSALRYFSLTANYTRVESAIEYTEEYTLPDGTPVSQISTRPMQGQAPWMVNFSFLFNHPGWGTSFNILYNKIGKRLSAVGDTRDEDVYEMPRDLVDLAITQNLGSRIHLKLGVRNVRSEPLVYTSGPEETLHASITDSIAYALKLACDL